MSGGTLQVGISGLAAFQRSLGTIGQNIANVNTEGYSRQRVDLTARNPSPSSNGFIGNGVTVQTVRRFYDSFAVSQVRSRSAAAEYFTTYNNLASQVDNLLADPDAGVSSALNSFFDAVQGVADDPSSVSAREVMLTEAQGLVDRFQTLDDWLKDLNKTTNDRIISKVGEINSLARNIAKMNSDIVIASGLGAGQPPNDLLDKRDKLIDDLSKLISVRVVEGSNNSINVYIGRGQSLVLDTNYMQLEAKINPDDPELYEVAYQMPNGTSYFVTDTLTGGELGGVIAFRNEILNPTQNKLGRLAMGIAMTFNEQQRLGVDLDGLLGEDFFIEPEPEAAAGVDNTGTETLTVTVNDITAITTDDYALSYDGSNYILTNLSNNSRTTLTVASAGPPIVFDPVDGLDFQLSGTPNAGDEFFIRPTRGAARIFERAIDNPNRIAAAGPLVSGISNTNLGNGEISEAVVVDFSNPALTANPGALTPPILIVFDDPPVPTAPATLSYSIYDNTTPGAPVLLEANISYDVNDPNNGHDIFPSPGGLDYGYTVRIDGEPQPGDQFTVSFNSNGVSDNRNALLLADLQQKGTLIGGNATYSDVYNETVVYVGNRTRQAEINQQAQTALLDEAKSMRESVSGVNLDEEAANLLRYQQAYAAAAQVISAADQLFQILLGTFRS